MRIIAITNQKGGVGKTTTAINLSAALSSQGKKVLLIDSDPQGNATMGSGVMKSSIGKSLYQILLGEINLDEAIIEATKTDNTGYDLIATNQDLAGAEVELVEFRNRELILKAAISNSCRDYEFVIIDCPPALNLLTVNSLVAASEVLIPMQCEYYALEGLSDLVDTIRIIKKRLNPKLQIEGLIRTMYDQRNTLSQQVSEELIKNFKNKVYETIIPRNIRLAEAPSFGIPGVFFDKGSKGAKSYFSLAIEVLKRKSQRG